jgi:hypothetical protein
MRIRKIHAWRLSRKDSSIPYMVKIFLRTSIICTLGAIE